MAKICPIVVRLHSPSFVVAKNWETDETVFMRQQRRMETRFIRRVTAVSAPSQSVIELVKDAFVYPDLQAEIIPNPVPIPRLTHFGSEAIASRRVLFIGRMTPLKGFGTLVHSFGKLLGAVPDATLDLVGPDDKGVLHNGMQPFARQFMSDEQARRVAEATTWHGYVPNDGLERFRSTAACVVIPSQYETFGYTLVEAMAMGCPIVATRVGGMAEIVIHGHNGLLVNPDSPDELAEAIRHMISNPDEARIMGEHARRTVQEKFVPSRVATEMAIWYARVRKEWVSDLS